MISFDTLDISFVLFASAGAWVKITISNFSNFFIGVEIEGVFERLPEILQKSNTFAIFKKIYNLL